MLKNIPLLHKFFLPFVAAASLAMSVNIYATQVDVLVIYDNETNNYYNGSPNTAIRSMVDQANTYYKNSRVDIQLNLVGTSRIEMKDDLGAIRSDNRVKALRNSTNADFVTYLSGSYSDGCGRGYLTTSASNAFNMVARKCMARSYVHELGHNMGLGHSVAQDSSGRDYKYGIGFGSQNVFSTLMAYESAYKSPRRTYLFSNPDYKCSGRTCGQENVADSARALNNIKDKIANHRKSTDNSTPNDKYISMRKQNSSSYALDTNNNGNNWQNIFLLSFNSNKQNQHWEEINRGNGYYSYKKRGTNLCIDGGNGGENGQSVYIWKCKDKNLNQQWRKVNLSGKYRLEKRNAPNYSIDGNNGGGDRQNVYLWRSSNTNQNQQWIFTPQE